MKITDWIKNYIPKWIALPSTLLLLILIGMLTIPLDELIPSQIKSLLLTLPLLTITVTAILGGEKALGQKVKSRIAPVSIRLVASAPTKARAEELLSNLEGPFNQYDDAKGNRLKFKHIGSWGLADFIRKFTYREYDYSITMPLSLAELSGIDHEDLVPRRVKINDRSLHGPGPRGREGINRRVGLKNPLEPPANLLKEFLILRRPVVKQGFGLRLKHFRRHRRGTRCQKKSALRHRKICFPGVQRFPVSSREATT